jgi:hypothetical protein
MIFPVGVAIQLRPLDSIILNKTAIGSLGTVQAKDILCFKAINEPITKKRGSPGDMGEFPAC